MIGELDSLCRGLNDVINMVNTSEKVGIKLELQQKLSEMMTNSLGLQIKMQEMLDENKKLQNRVEELEKVNVLESDIEYYEDAFVTLKSDPLKRKLCQKCWVKERKLYQIQPRYFNGKLNHYECLNCAAKLSDRREFKNSSVMDLKCNTKYDPFKDM